MFSWGNGSWYFVSATGWSCQNEKSLVSIVRVLPRLKLEEWRAGVTLTHPSASASDARHL